MELIWYPELIERFFPGGKLDLKIDYFGGCYRLYRKLTPFPPNMTPPLNILSKIDGLEVNHLTDSLCCLRPAELDALFDNMKSETIVNTCPLCQITISDSLKGRMRALMLPELVLAADRQRYL